jgi:hypothetical protein
MKDEIDLPAVCAEMRAMGVERVSYRRLYQAILDGKIPAERSHGRYRIARGDLPAIAASLGLTVRAGASEAA